MAVDIGIEVGTTAVRGVFAEPVRGVAAAPAHLADGFASALKSCLEEGAGRLGFSSVRGMLRKAGTVVISAPRIGAATFAANSGPKTGLLVTRGLEEEILSACIWPTLGADRIDMIEAVEEETGPRGEAMRAPQADQVRGAVRRLLQRGAETIVVSLRRSPLNPAHELMIRSMIEHEYPAHYLGAVPVVLSVDHGSSLDDAQRTRAALLNAYCMPATAKLLYEAEDILRAAGFVGILRVLDAAGNTVRICKSIPIECVDSDLAAGRKLSAAIVAGRCLEHVLILDVGASDARVGYLLDGEGSLAVGRATDSTVLGSGAPGFRCVGLGLHSVVAVVGGQVVVGPRLGRPGSCGSGDVDPTLTDALVTLGLLDLPATSSGSAGRTEFGDSTKLIETHVARHLDVGAEAASELAVNCAMESIADVLSEAMSSKGMVPSEVTVIALGGGSGSVCCGAAYKAGIGQVYSPPVAWASGALGSLVDLAGLAQTIGARAADGDPSGEPVGRRTILLEGASVEADVFRREDLRPGSVVAGPAVVESRGDTLIVPRGMTFTVDGLLGVTVSRAEVSTGQDALGAHAQA